MNKKDFHYWTYILTLLALIGLATESYIDTSHRLSWIAAIMATLGAAWIWECVGPRGRRVRAGEKSTFRLGFLEIDGRLSVGDQLSLKNSKQFLDLPKGQYSVIVETVCDRGGVYIGSVSLISSASCARAMREVVTVTVDTGFMIFIGTETSTEVLCAVDEAQKQILAAHNSAPDAVIVVVNGRNVGLVTASGHGDDQYQVNIECDEHHKAVISCCFL